MGSRRDYYLDRDYYASNVHPSISTSSNLLTVALGPGDCVCTDFADPRRLSGSNLPVGLKKLVADWLAERPDDFLDLDDDSDAAPTPPERTSDSDSRPTSRRRSRQRSNIDNEWQASATSDQKVGGREEIIIRRDDRTSNGVHEPRASSQESRISSLVFGSRYGEFGVVYCDRGQYYLDGPVFDRLSYLRDWIVPKYPRDKPLKRALITERDGARVRLFFGPESSYFAYDASTRQYIHNIQDRDLRDWLLFDCVEVLDRRTDDENTLKPNYLPHSFAMGPNDMWCWICKEDYKSNSAFQQVFPGIELFLKFAKRKRILDQVTLTVSSDAQPGSKQPYFVLSTSEGVCVSSVPADATDLISKATTRWGAISSAHRTRETRRLKQESKVAGDELTALKRKLFDASDLIDAGISSPRRGDPRDSSVDRVIAGLKQINDFCDLNAPKTSEDADRWAEASLANRVYMLFEGFGSQTTNSDPLSAAERAKMNRDNNIVNLLQERVVQAQLLLAQRSDDKPMVEGYPKPVDEMGYVLSEIKLIEDLVKENALQHNLDEWDVANLRSRIAMILKDNERTNRVIKNGTANAQSLIAQRGSIEPIVTGYGEAYDELSYVITEVRLIKELVDSNPTDDEAWNTSDLRTQIELILTKRRENAKDAMILKSMKEHLTIVMDRLGGEMAKLEADEFQERVLDFLKKVLDGDEVKTPSKRNDEDMIDEDA